MLQENMLRVKNEIAAAARRVGRNPAEVLLLAVSKTVGVEEVKQAAALGVTDFGENRVQDSLNKVQALPGLNWHFIGHLQSNKGKQVVEKFCLIHSLDRLSLAQELQRCAEIFNRNVDVLVQVNVSGEESKFGLEPQQLSSFLRELTGMPRIRIKGLMTMAPFVGDPEEARPVFRRLRELRQAHCRPELPLEHLSMGMTNDFTVAVEEGATIVRIGSALFD